MITSLLDPSTPEPQLQESLLKCLDSLDQIDIPVLERLIALLDTSLAHYSLDIIQRLPHNELVKSCCPSLMLGLLRILRNTTPVLAIAALKIIVDLHKNFKMLLVDSVQPFLDIVHEMYQNLESVVSMAFSPSTDTNTLLNNSMFSFQVAQINTGLDRLSGNRSSIVFVASQICCAECPAPCSVDRANHPLAASKHHPRTNGVAALPRFKGVAS